MSTQPTKGEPFFYYIGLVLLLTIIFAFSSYSMMGMSKFNSWGPIIAIHGASILLCRVDGSAPANTKMNRRTEHFDIAVQKSNLGASSIWDAYSF